MSWFSLLLIGASLFQGPSLEDAIVSFEISHMGVLTVEGQFDEVRGQIKQASKSEWLIEGEVDVTSIDTGNSTRDETILTEQYLNAESFPTIPFKAQLTKSSEKMSITIDLKLRGADLQLMGELKEENGKLVSESITFKRSDIGLDFGLMDSLIGDEITINIDSGIKRRLH